MTIQSIYRTFGGAFATLALASFAAADGIDVLIAEPASGSGKTFVGSVNKGTADGDVDGGARVFEAGTVLDLGDSVWETEEPGFFTGSIGTNPVLPAGASQAGFGLTVSVFERSFAIGTSANADLFYWDGVGSPNFAPATNASFSLEPEGVIGGGAVTSDGGTLFGAPLVVYDNHPDYLIEGDGGSAAPVGVYLASIEAQLEGFDRSEPIYLVFATRDAGFLGLDPSETDEEVIEEALEGFLDPAVEWVELNVPEPSAALLAVLAATGVVAGRVCR